MPQPSRESDAFIARVEALPTGPGVSLDAVLQPSLDEEKELRTLFATDRQHERVANPHVGLVDVFDAPESIRTTRARVVQEGDLSAKYVMPLSAENRRPEGAPAIVSDLEEFKKNWAIFTEGSLSQLLDWNNVVAAGGSVLACLTPLEEEDKKSKRAIRKHYHSKAYPTSDVDLFLWGLNAEQAEAKIKYIYEAVRDSVPWDVTCIRTKHTISIHSQYPYRSVQIVLRLYHSPAEILAGFDIDAPCCAYDGNRVWANPRAVVAMMRQCNTVDMTRRSPSYEVRLSKYSSRFYEVYVPTLEREMVDPTIYERSIAKMEGLARLLVLEKLLNDNMRDRFLTERRNLRGRPDENNNRSYHRRRRNNRYKGDLKVETGLGVQLNDYDVASLHIPYGPGWDAKRIDKLVYQTDLGMNSTFNPKNKGRRLHRHPAFFGTIEECIEDCCEHCPEPIDDDERKLQTEEEDLYIRGRIKFMEDNPGRQNILTGSFNPIDEGEWAEQVYMKPTEKLFIAIVQNDRATVKALLEDTENVNVNQRDHVGRTALHVAIIAGMVEIAEDLIDAGARITARLADGKAALHLAAQYDHPSIIKKLLEKSAQNKAELEAKNGKPDEDEDMDKKGDVAKNSSEDDWSSHDEDDVNMSDPDDDADAEDEDDEDEDDDDDDDEEGGRKKKKKSEDEEAQDEKNVNEVPEDETDEPDIIEIDIPDWDLGFSALCYAVLFASPATLDTLIAGGASVNTATKPSAASDNNPVHPLTLTLIREDEDEGCQFAELLIKAGASSSTADNSLKTIFHVTVAYGRTKVVETILRCDPNAQKVINFPSIMWRSVTFPLSTAFVQKRFAIFAVLLAHGAKLNIEESDITLAVDSASEETKKQLFGYNEVKNYLELVTTPVELAVSLRSEIVHLLLALGAEVNFGLKEAIEYHDTARRRTIKDFVDWVLNEVDRQLYDRERKLESTAAAVLVSKADLEPEEEPKNKWLAWYKKHTADYFKSDKTDEELAEDEEGAKRPYQYDWQAQTARRLDDAKVYYEGLKVALAERGAKTWNVVFPGQKSTAQIPVYETKKIEEAESTPVEEEPPKKERSEKYYLLSEERYGTSINIPEHQVEAYDDLMEACFLGDNERIQRLCLPVPGQAVPGGPKPLRITIRMTNGGPYDRHGYTPFYAAIANRKWSTAKLILAIAAAQYHPKEDNDKIKFDADIDMDDDSDNDSDVSDSSDITIEQKQITFIDIATRPSEVQCECHPRAFFNVESNWRKEPETPDDTSRSMRNKLIDTAAILGDLEGFVHIANLYESLDKPITLPESILSQVLTYDRVDILDEYIRRTGSGIDIAGAQKDSGDTEPVPVATNDDNKVYLGLNVHGKKRADLARKNDPNAEQDDSDYRVPLLWEAQSKGATKCIEYLASKRPLEAYKFFANTRATSKALWLKRFGPTELEKWLPTWLGWTINTMGESPVSAAILNGNVDILKLVAKLEPKLVSQGLASTIKFLGLNPISLAVRSRTTEKMFDYLLSRKISPVEKDTIRGWNILHDLCNSNAGDMLEYVLKKLPREVCENLLTQKSKLRENTPLHIAVKGGNIRPVEIILEFSKKTILTQDVDGRTPLHCAAARSYPKLAKILLAAMPQGSLYIEDGVGNTALEIASLLVLVSKAKSHANAYNLVGSGSRWSSGGRISASYYEERPQPIEEEDIKAYEAEFAALDYVVETMIDRGTLSEKEKSKLKAEVRKWVEKTRVKVQFVKDRKEKREAEEKAKNDRREAREKKKRGADYVEPKPNPTDDIDLEETLKVLREASKAEEAAGIPRRRQLIRLLDVQHSVRATLAKLNPKAPGSGYEEIAKFADLENSYGSDDGNRGNEEELEKEADEDTKMRENSMVFRHVGTAMDTA